MFTPQAHAAISDSVADLMDRILDNIINPLIGFIFVLALLYFVWGVVRFIMNRDSNSDKANEGKSHMLWGIVGMFIMLSVFGIMHLIVNTLQG